MAQHVTFKIFGSSTAQFEDAAEVMLSKVGKGILSRAQRLVPKDTWSLHDSLEVETSRPKRGRVEVRVGVNEDFTGPFGDIPALYAQLVEDGTSKMAAQPYLMPALLQTIGALR